MRGRFVHPVLTHISISKCTAVVAESAGRGMFSQAKRAEGPLQTRPRRAQVPERGLFEPGRLFSAGTCRAKCLCELARGVSAPAMPLMPRRNHRPIASEPSSLTPSMLDEQDETLRIDATRGVSDGTRGGGVGGGWGACSRLERLSSINPMATLEPRETSCAVADRRPVCTNESAAASCSPPPGAAAGEWPRTVGDTAPVGKVLALEPTAALAAASAARDSSTCCLRIGTVPCKKERYSAVRRCVRAASARSGTLSLPLEPASMTGAAFEALEEAAFRESLKLARSPNCDSSAPASVATHAMTCFWEARRLAFSASTLARRSRS